MIDHAYRIAEQKRLTQIECYAMPVVFVFIFSLSVILVDFALDTYAEQRYNDQIVTAKMFAECLNGNEIQIGKEDFVSCRIQNVRLVEGLK